MKLGVLIAALPASVPLALLLLAISFVFTGVEAGLLAVNPARLRTRARAGDAAAQRLERLLSRPERLMAAALLVTNFMDLAALALVTGRLVETYGLAGYPLAAALALPVYLIGVRLLPKALFRRFPIRILAALGGVLEAASLVAAPVLALGGWISRAAGLGGAFDPLRLSIAREQFATLLESDAGTLSPQQKTMVRHALAFRRKSLGEYARPVPPPFLADDHATVSDAIGYAAQTGLKIVAMTAPDGRIRALERINDLVLSRKSSCLIANLPAPIVIDQADSGHRALRRLRAERRDVALVSTDGAITGCVTADDLAQVLLTGQASA